jgi:hypothetical protein
MLLVTMALAVLIIIVFLCIPVSALTRTKHKP